MTKYTAPTNATQQHKRGVYVAPRDFIDTLFPPDLLTPDERPVVAYPDSFVPRDTGKTIEYYRQFHPAPRQAYAGRSTYFCVSTVERQRKRQVKKRLADVRTAMVLVLDDIGTKATAPAVAPSYVLETSTGNYQWGYLIEPYDVSTPAGQRYYDAVLWSMAAAGHNDEGMRSASRLARMPGSLHRSGFVSRVVSWDPHRVWELAALFALFDVPWLEPRVRRALAPGPHVALSEVDDPIYDWLLEQKLVLGHNDQWVFIECPWRGEHTKGAQGASSTAYSPDGYGLEGIGFKCLHGHCAERTVADFMNWVNHTKFPCGLYAVTYQESTTDV